VTQLDFFDTMANQPKTTPAICAGCGAPFPSRDKDRKQGNGRYCSRTCSATKPEKSANGVSLAPTSHPSNGHRLTQKETVLRLLQSRAVVTNADFDRIGLAYIARNRVSELRREGYVIAQKGGGQGEAWLRNAYRLLGDPGTTFSDESFQPLRADGWIIDPKERRSTCAVQ
jgi:hypothetical protein